MLATGEEVAEMSSARGAASAFLAAARFAGRAEISHAPMR